MVTSRSRFRARLVIAWLAPGILGSLTGCHRGWLATVLRDFGVMSGVPAESPPPSAPPAIPMGGTDCPDGLARCVGGSIEVSRLGYVPANCLEPRPGSRAGPAGCVCPWQAIGTCPTACVAEGREIAIAESLAVQQLCAPPAGVAVVRPPPSAFTGAVAIADCDDGDHACVLSTAITCAPPADDGGVAHRAVGFCVFGCAWEGAILDDRVTDEEASLLLCKRH